MSNKDRKPTDFTATAPYNFIPLNGKVVDFNYTPNLDRFYKNDSKEEKFYTGEIEIEITNITPLFIGDNNENKNNYFSFNVLRNNKKQYCIPGSSLRGLLRNSIEIVSYGKFQNINQKVGNIDLFKFIPKAIEEANKNSDFLDLSECLFGKETCFATRLYFEDLICTNLKGINEKSWHKILSTPNITAVKFYLDNKEVKFVKDIKQYDTKYNLNPKNSRIIIRGYKQYHHRKDDYKTNKPNKNMSKEVMTIKENSTFKGKMRFVNLKNYELGALMFILNLPDGCKHKIGGLKPLGLGSIDIKTKVRILDIDQHYKAIFENDNFKDNYNYLSDEDIKNHIKLFDELMLKKLENEQKYKTIWNLPRMVQYKAMLDYKTNITQHNWRTKTEYTVGKGNSHKILPRPSELVKKQG